MIDACSSGNQPDQFPGSQIVLAQHEQKTVFLHYVLEFQAMGLCSAQVYLKGRARRHANTEETVANADFVMDSNSSVTYGKITHQARLRSLCCSLHGKSWLLLMF